MFQGGVVRGANGGGARNRQTSQPWVNYADQEEGEIVQQRKN